MAPRTDRHRTRPITAPAPDADTTCGPRCATSMVARRLASPHRGRIYDCSRFDATPRRPRQHAALEERHADQGPCGGRGGMRATAAGGASSRASAAPPLRCGPAGDPPPAAVDRQLWPEARFRPGTDRHRPPSVPRRSRRCRLPPPGSNDQLQVDNVEESIYGLLSRVLIGFCSRPWERPPHLTASAIAQTYMPPRSEAEPR